MKLKIAQIKVYPHKGDLEKNHLLLMDVLQEIGKEKPDVVITPECFLDGYVNSESYSNRENMHQYAIDPDNSLYAKAAADWAAAHNAWFIYGCSRIAPEGVYNSALIFNRSGNRIGIYDKTQVARTPDAKHLAGKSLPVFDSDFGPFGVLICADRRWPETTRTLALKGARIIFNPTYGFNDSLNFCMMRTRAYESEIIIAFTHPGQALTTGPRRQIYVNDEEKTHRYAIAHVDLTHVDRARVGRKCHLLHRRTDIYELDGE